MSDEEKKKTRAVNSNTVVTDEDVLPSSSFIDDYYEPSVTLSVFVYWILPILVIAFMTRFVVDPDAAIGIGIGGSSSSSSRIPVIDKPTATATQPPSSLPTTTNTYANTNTEMPTLSPTPKRPKRKPTPVPTLVAEKPSSYIEAMQAINRRRLVWEDTDTDDMSGGSGSGSKSAASSSTSTNNNNKNNKANKNKQSAPERPPRGASTDPVRTQLREKIDELREDHEVCIIIIIGYVYVYEYVYVLNCIV